MKRLHIYSVFANILKRKKNRYTVFSAKQVLFPVAIYKEKVATIDLNVYWPGEQEMYPNKQTNKDTIKEKQKNFLR